MVQISTSATTPKMAKSKTPKKSSAVATPAKTEVKTPKKAKNTPAKAAAQTPKTPKMKKEVQVKETMSTPKAAPKTPKNGTASAKKSKKAKTPKQEKPAEDVEMASEGEEEKEEAPPAQPSPKKSEKEVDNESEDAEVSSEEEIVIKPNSNKSNNQGNKKVGSKFSIFIRGLNYNSLEQAVSAHFSQFGTVKTCRVPRNPTKKHLCKGFGFVEFESQEAMDQALAAAHTLDSRTLIVASSDPESAAKRKRDESQQPGGAYKRQMTASETELFVARLSHTTTKDAIEKHFSQFGEVESVGLPMSTRAGDLGNKGFAFVAFKDALSAAKAIAEENHEIESSKIVVEPRKKVGATTEFTKPSHPNELFVGGLNPITQRHTLEQHFSKYGQILNITLPWNKITHKNRGYSFVSFQSAESLEAALAEDHEIDGKAVGAKSGGAKSQENGADSKKANAKKVKAVPAKMDEEEDDDEDEEEVEGEDEEEVEGEDEEMEGEEAESDDEEAESDGEAEGEDEEVEGEDEEVEGEDEEVEGEEDDEAEEESGEEDDDDE